MLSLQGKCALVTGASRGIVASIAVGLDDLEGAAVLLCYHAAACITGPCRPVDGGALASI